MHPYEIEVIFRVDKKKWPITEHRCDDKRQEDTSREKDHLRMKKLTEVINSSAHSRLFAMQWNRDKDKWESGKGQSTKDILQPHDIRNTESSTGNEEKSGLVVAGLQQVERGIWH
jgi:hypothetical protein